MAHSSSVGLSKRPFGSTGLLVEPLWLGTSGLGDTDLYGAPPSKERSLETIRAIFAGPIHAIDTSNNYGNGRSEEYIGIVLREIGGLPPGFFLSTKADRDMKTGDFSGERMRRSVKESQERLGMERFPIMFLHDPETSTWENLTAPGGAVDALVKLREEGVIEHLGVAGGPIDLLMRYVELGVFEAVITHNRYNLISREAEPLIQMASERGLAVVNAAPYGSGLLAKGPDAYPRFCYRPADAATLEKGRHIEAICVRYGVPLPAAALQFSLRDRRLCATIVGVSRPERVAQTYALATQPIPEEMWAELEEVTGR